MKLDPIFYAALGLFVLLAGSIIYLFVLNSKKRFREKLFKELENCEEGSRMDIYHKALIEKIIQQVKNEISSTLPIADPSDMDNSDDMDLDDVEDGDTEETSITELPQSLYADNIINGQFHRVKEQPDEDTIFELILSKAGDVQAKVIVYEPAHKRVIANPAFLEGCEKQILNNATSVTMQREGIAQKDVDIGKWMITTTPEVIIS